MEKINSKTIQRFKMKLDIEEIKSLLPHRPPFLFIDSCEIIEIGKQGIGYKKFSADEYFFKGHFPNMPIVPGVILVEALAQTAGIVVAKSFSEESENSVLFISISNAKFRKRVSINDEIMFEVKIINKLKSFYKFYGEAKKGSEKMCEAVFSAMIVEKK